MLKCIKWNERCKSAARIEFQLCDSVWEKEKKEGKGIKLSTVLALLISFFFFFDL